MTCSGIVDGLAILDYIRDPAPAPSLSASIAHVLLTTSARHAQLAHPRLNPAWEPDATNETDLGTIAHAVLLENDRSRLAVIDAKDWRTKAAQESRDNARLAGLLPILVDRMRDVDAMVAVAREAIEANPDTRGLLATGRIESTLIWPEGEAWCRCRPDIISDDTRVLLDYKTTSRSAEPYGFAATLLNHGYDLQGALMLRGAAALVGERDWSAIFMAQETEAPYAVAFVGLDPQYVVFAQARLDAALRLWTHCLATGEWPAYPTQTCWTSPPEWAVARFADRMALIPADPDDESVEAL